MIIQFCVSVEKPVKSQNLEGNIRKMSDCRNKMGGWIVLASQLMAWC